MLTHPIPPHPNCCVASTMCSCATNVNTSHPTPPQPRVTMYVAANPRGNLRDRRAGKRTFCSVYNGRNTLARASLRPTGAKNKHSHWKNNSGLKNPINSYEKTAQHRFTKCLKPKKQTLSLKNNSGLKNPINSYEKTARHRLTNCLKPKKQTLSLKKQFWS